MKLDEAAAIDISFKMLDGGDLEITVNGVSDSFNFLKENLDYASITDEVYVGFMNCFTDMRASDFNLAVLHGGDAECKAGEEAPKQEDLEALVDDVHKAIDGLKAADDLTLEDEADVAAVRAKVDALNVNLKELLDADKLSKLTAAEAKIAELKEAADAAGAEEAAKVVEMIDAIIAGEITLESEAAIVAAEKAYAALSEKHQDLVTNYVDLALARVALDALKENGSDDSTDSGTTDDNKDDNQDENQDDNKDDNKDDGEGSADTGVAEYPIFAAILLLTAAAAVVVIKKKKAM